jgi:two-component system chemotaxis response regulator CheY
VPPLPNLTVFSRISDTRLSIHRRSDHRRRAIERTMTDSVRETVSSLLNQVSLPRLKSDICDNVRILVVDDDPIVRSIALVLLGKFGFNHVDEAPDGPAALALVAAGDYELIISDHVMEPMNGIALFRALRAQARTRSVPFVLLTSSMQHETVYAAKRAGIRHYVLKPFRLEALHQKLVELLMPYGNER